MGPVFDRVCRLGAAVAVGGLATGLVSHRVARAAGEFKLVLDGQSGALEPGASTWCSTSAGGLCSSGEKSVAAGGFRSPTSVAVSASTGAVYVADDLNARVQELSPGGDFVAMFGWDVNATKRSEQRVTQQERNVCT